MIDISVEVGTRTIKLPSVYPGKNGSITDHADSTILVFTCNKNDKNGTLHRSVAGIHIDVGDSRIIDSVDYRLETLLISGQTYRIPMKYGPSSATLVLKHHV